MQMNVKIENLSKNNTIVFFSTHSLHRTHSLHTQSMCSMLTMCQKYPELSTNWNNGNFYYICGFNLTIG